MITFFTKTITKRTPLGQRQTVQNEGITVKNFYFSKSYCEFISEYFVHVYMRQDGLCGCVTADNEVSFDRITMDSF